MKRILFAFVLCIPLLMSAILPSNQMNQTNSPFNVSREWNITSVLREYDSEGNWNPSERSIYYYNPLHTSAIDSIVVESWNVSTASWEEVAKTILTYDETYEYIIEGINYFNMMGMVFPYARHEADYDDSARLTNYRVYLYGFVNRNEMLVNQTMFQYNTGSEFEMFSYKTGLDRPMDEWEHSTFTYDAQGRIINETIETSVDSLNWDLNKRYTNQYHPNDNTTGQSFIEALAHLMPRSMILNDVSFVGMTSSITEEHWSGIDWVPDTIEDYAWDDDENLSEIILQYWLTDAWIPDSRTDYFYDTNGNNSQQIDSYWDDGSWYHSRRLTFNWNNTTENCNDVQEMQTVKLHVFPNPFTSSTVFKTDEKSITDISVFNLRGQLVRKLNSNNKHEVYWDGKNSKGKEVATGLYFIRAKHNKQSSSVKVLKVK